MEEITMKTKGLTQDNEGHYGVWRTGKREGKYFIRVGESAEQAVARKIKYLLSVPTKKLQKQQKDDIQSKIFEKSYEVNKQHKKSDVAKITIYSWQYIYKIEVYKNGKYKIINKRKNK